MRPVLKRLDEERIGDTQNHVRSAEDTQRQSGEGQTGEFRQTGELGCVSYSRGLGPGRVLSELAVMDGEIWTKVTAELQRADGAERKRHVR